MYHDYNPHETKDEYLSRKTRAEREFAIQHRKDKAGRRKRVKATRHRQHWKLAHR